MNIMYKLIRDKKGEEGSIIFDEKKLIEARNKENKILDFIKNKDEDFIEYLDGFITKTKNIFLKEKNYDIGVYTIGFSPYTTMLSLALLRPKEEVTLIYTVESLKYKELYNEFFEFIELDVKINEKIIKDGSDTAEVFQNISNSIKGYGDKNIAIDITGGKKPTVASGFLAASLNRLPKNIDVLYLDFSEYKDDRPIYGSEFLSVLLNPTDIFSTVEQEALEKLYKSKNFKGSRILAENILKRLEQNVNELKRYGMEDQINNLKKILYFSSLYELRNNFNYEAIKIEKLYLSIEEIETLERLTRFSKGVKKIKDDRNLYKKYNNTSEIIYTALDRYNGAIMMKNIDLQSYITRLLSVVEISGIILSKGEKARVVDKINILNNRLFFDLYRDLNSLRKDRNNLSIIHGFNSAKDLDNTYEKAVLEYMSIAFNMNKKDLKDILNKRIRYREYEEIFLK